MNYFVKTYFYVDALCSYCYSKDHPVHRVVEAPFNVRLLREGEIPKSVTKEVCKECMKRINETRTIIDSKRGLT